METFVIRTISKIVPLVVAAVSANPSAQSLAHVELPMIQLLSHNMLIAVKKTICSLRVKMPEYIAPPKKKIRGPSPALPSSSSTCSSLEHVLPLQNKKNKKRPQNREYALTHRVLVLRLGNTFNRGSNSGSPYNTGKYLLPPQRRIASNVSWSTMTSSCVGASTQSLGL